MMNVVCYNHDLETDMVLKPLSEKERYDNSFYDFPCIIFLMSSQKIDIAFGVSL